MKWTKTDSENHIDQNTGSLIIPKEIKEIESDAFINLPISLKSIEITNNETIIPKNCFENCVDLKSITFPFNNNQLNIGNKIFSIENNHMDQLFYLPVSIEIINGNKFYNNNKIEIPSTITSIGKNCFEGCYYLKYLTLPELLTTIPHDIFSKTNQLKYLQISSQFITPEKTPFIVRDNCLYSLRLPHSIKQVNGKYVESLKTFTIPSNVTKLSDYCFVHCKELTEIKGLEQIKEFGKESLNSIMNITVPIEDKWKTIYGITLDQIKQLEEWTELKCGEVLFDSNVDDWKVDTLELNERIIGKKQLTFLIEDDNEEIFGYYLNTEIIEKYNKIMETDFKSFEFNLYSNGRLLGPMKFEIKNTKKGGYYLNESGEFDCTNLILIGTIELMKELYAYESTCHEPLKKGDQIEYLFDYHGFDKALCGKIGNSFGGERFTVKKFVVIQMKK